MFKKKRRKKKKKKKYARNVSEQCREMHCSLKNSEQLVEQYTKKSQCTVH